MGFIIKYKRFLSVSLREEGGAEPIGGFVFFATSETGRTLRNHNMLFRPLSTGFCVYYSSAPVIPITEKARFTFGFKNSNRHLFDKYGLSKKDSSDTSVYEPGLYFDNLASDGSIITEQGSSLVASGAGADEYVAAEDTGHFYNQTFSIVQSSIESISESYILKHRYNSSIEKTIPVNTAEDAHTVVTIINPAGKEEDYISESGPYLLQTISPESSRNIYLNNELTGKSARGVVDIYWETAQDSVDEETGQQYYITFKPK